MPKRAGLQSPPECTRAFIDLPFGGPRGRIRGRVGGPPNGSEFCCRSDALTNHKRYPTYRPASADSSNSLLDRSRYDLAELFFQQLKGEIGTTDQGAQFPDRRHRRTTLEQEHVPGL